MKLIISLFLFGLIVTGEAAVRIVNCDQPVQSRKRGICANHLGTEDFRALAPGVSWFYNWHYETKDAPPAGVAIEFMPMAWSDRPADVVGLENYLAAGHKPRAVLAINEPNLKGQAFITPETTAKLYGQIKTIADKYQRPVVGPHMALGSGKDSSIHAFDPIENKEVTYTFMVPFLKAFLYFAGKTEVAAAACHTYGPVEELRWAVETLHKEFNCPVWLTEFAYWKAANPAAAKKFLIQATDFLERTPYVAGYAWFKERAKDNPKISLLDAVPGKLTPLGEAYVAMPVHDADLFYRLPGRLPAGNYAGMNQIEVQPTTDHDGLLDVVAKESGAWVDLNLQVDTPGTYSLSCRVGGAPGQIEILKNNQPLTTMTGTQKDWETITASASLPAGTQTLRVRFTAKNQTLHWIEFVKK